MRVNHPFLAEIYALEKVMLEETQTKKTALVTTGELFVDSVLDS